MAKQKKQSDSQSGSGTLLLAVFGIGAFYLLGKIAAAIGRGAKACFPFLIVPVIIYALSKLSFYRKHQKPLTYEEIRILANTRARNYINTNYKFSTFPVRADPLFKSKLDATGRWYEIHEPLSTFPSYVSSLLHGKHHEWVVIAIERNGIVCNMWANKGSDNKSVSINCNISEIVRKCKEVGGYSILRFHNHPNSNPALYTTLLASEQDKISAKSCSDFVCKEKINWFDFVCANGNFVQFFSRIANGFEIDGNRTSDIIDVSGITPQMDYELQKEFHKKDKKPKPAWIVGILVMVLLLFYAVGSSDTTSDSSIDTTSTSPEAESLLIEEAEPTAEPTPMGTLSFADAASFEEALNGGNIPEKAIIPITPTEIHPFSGDGFNIWAGEHLNFISEDDPGIQKGDTALIETTDITTRDGAWFIRYRITSINGSSPLPDNTSTVPAAVSKDGVDYVYNSSLGGYAVTGAEEATNITIPAAIDDVPVVAVAAKAFYKHESLATINLPDSIVEIGAEAFGWCKALESFVFPHNVTVVSKMTFWNCTSLSTIKLNNSITVIEDNAFYSCPFTTIRLPAKLYSIGDKAFEECRYLKLVTVPEGVVSIGDKAFIWCQSLKSISLPDSLILIGGGCFRSCEKLDSIVIPPKVESLNWECFVYCSSLATIKVPSSCKLSLQDGKLNSCNAKIITY